MKKSIAAALSLGAVIVLIGLGQAAAQDNAIKRNEFGAVKLADERAALDNFALDLQSEPPAQAYIITYGGRKSTPTAAATASQRAWKWLVGTRGIDPSRIVRIDGGYREEPTTEL